jgi:hypothetical protein
MLLPLATGANTATEWHFRVYLEDKAIGFHRFSLEQRDSETRLATEARFDVTFLTIPVFRYRHSNVEVWNDGCLESIESSTDENGKQFRVKGSADDEGFRLTTQGGESILPACINTFAYWNQAFLDSSRLLNAQTGEFLDVQVSDLGQQVISVRDAEQAASRYRLDIRDAAIDLWYSEHGEWLALQSTTASGRVLRYVLE